MDKHVFAEMMTIVVVVVAFPRQDYDVDDEQQHQNQI